MSTTPALTIRASSFGGLFDCAMRWEAIHLLGLVSWSSPRALIGTGTHVGTAAFDLGRMEGQPISYDDAVGHTIDAIHMRLENEPVKWHADEPNQREVERIATRLTLNYCEHISPRYEFEAVELTCTPLDIDVDGTVIRLSGHLDRTRVIANETTRGKILRLADLKTGRSVVNAHGKVATAKHRPQLGSYELLYEHTTQNTLDPVSEILGMNTAGDYRVGVGEVRDSRRLLVGDAENPGLIRLAAQMAKSGLYPPNPQSALCSKKYCPRHATCLYADHSDD